MIEEISHQLEKLILSQAELSDALDEDPHDADFIQAINENEIVIIRKREKILELREMLARIDPAFREEIKALKNISATSIQIPLSSGEGLLDNPHVNFYPQSMSIYESELSNNQSSDIGVYL